MIWDGASTKSHSVSAPLKRGELGAREAHVQDVAELVEEGLHLGVLEQSEADRPRAG